MTVLDPIIGPSGIYASLCDGQLVIAGVALRGPAWWLVDLSPAWDYGDKRGNNVEMPRASGERAYNRRRTGTTYNFQMAFGGLFTPAGGTGSTNAMAQMYSNYATLRNDIVTDPGSPTLPSTLTTPDGVDHDTPVQVLNMKPGTLHSSGALLASLQIRVPAGGWV